MQILCNFNIIPDAPHDPPLLPVFMVEARSDLMCSVSDSRIWLIENPMVVRGMEEIPITIIAKCLGIW